MTNDQRKKIVKVELLETFAEIIDTLYGSPMGASGQDHAPGQVPDPGAIAGTSKYLREDGTWVTPPNDNTTYQFSQSGNTLQMGTNGGSKSDIYTPSIPVSSVAGKTGAVTLDKSDIGLGNVTNDAQVKRSEMGVASGVATLDSTGKVPSSQLPSGVGPTVNKTWAELKAMRDGGTLVPGQWYRITDYTCTTTQENTQSAGHVFDIIVRADATNKLNENAYAALHSGDTYFANSKLEAWQLKYSLENDTTKFAWADSTNGKGVIYYMKDEFNNECPYDFKNIQFKRYQLKNQNSLHLADYPMGESDYSAATQTAFNVWKAKLGNAMNANNAAFYYTKGVYSDGYVVNGAEIYDYSSDYESYDNGNLIFDDGSGGNYVGVAYIYDYFDVIAEVVNTTGEWFYTFSKKSTTAATPTDASMDTNCYENSINGYFNSGVQNLNDTIFIVIGNSITAYGNSFNTNCYNNTFGNNCNRNTFGNECYSNSFGNYCYNNTFGNYCNRNTFGNNFQYNTFGNNCYSNSFGNNCNRNTFGNECYSNSFGNGCYSNSFGNNFQYNTFGNNFQYNTFGNNCNNNSFGNYCYNNTFGNNFQYNTFGNNCNNNSFGNNCYSITSSKDYCCYNIFENGNRFITLTSTQTTSNSNMLRNIKICQGVNNSSTRKEISHNTVNDTFQTEYKPANSQVISV